MSLVITIDWISAVMCWFIVIFSTTKWNIKIKVRLYLNAFGFCATILILLKVYLLGLWGSVITTIIYLICYIVFHINYTKIYHKAKKGEVYDLV